MIHPNVLPCVCLNIHVHGQEIFTDSHTHTNKHIHSISSVTLSTIITIDQTENSIVTETQFKTGHT